jgi:hypothetical protein
MIPEKFLIGCSPLSVCQNQATQFAIDQHPLITSIPEQTDSIITRYDKLVPVLWQLCENALEHWRITAFHAGMAFAINSLDHSCLLDSAELGRVVAAFNKTTRHKGLNCSLAGVSEHINDRMQHLSFPVSTVGSFIVVQDDNSFMVMAMVLDVIIRCVTAAGASDRWFVKDMVYQAQQDYPSLLTAEEVPMAIYELTRLALESGTQGAFRHMLGVWVTHKDKMERLFSDHEDTSGDMGMFAAGPSAVLPDHEPLVFEDFLHRTSFAPKVIKPLTLFLLEQNMVTPSGLIAKILVPARQTDIYVVQQGCMARLQCIQGLIEACPPKRLSNFLYNETVVPEAWKVSPAWACVLAPMWTQTHNLLIDNHNILSLALKLEIGLVLQLAIVVVDMCDDRETILAENQPLIHELFLKSVHQACRKPPYQDVWKEIVLRLSRWIPDKLVDYMGKGFRSKTLIKGKKKRSRLVLMPTPLAILLYYGLSELLEPFCRGTPPAPRIDNALVVLLLQKNQSALIPVLCRLLGCKHLSNNALLQICSNVSLHEAQGIIGSLCESPERLLHQSIVKKNALARSATMQVLRQRGASTRDIVYALLESTRFEDTDFVRKLAAQETPITPQLFSDCVKTSNIDDARTMLTAYPPVLLMTMDPDVWESMPRVWSTHKDANKAYAKPPRNGLAAAIRYRRVEFVTFLLQEFPDMVRKCISKYTETVSEATWLSMESVEHELLELSCGPD